jgi:hypothetical protein
MKLAFAEHFKGNVYVSGFQDKTPDGAPATSTGNCVACYQDWMEYESTTQQGLSGSAVWIEYRKNPMVVAIHNNRPLDRDSGSRGARLTPELFREIYTWLGSNVLQTGVQLHATDIRKKPTPPTLPSAGLFLSFKQDFGFGRVRLGSGTQFDLMPAQVMFNKVLYAMWSTTDGKWALFDVSENKIELGEKVREACLFRKYKKDPKKAFFRLVIEIGEESVQLKMEGKSIEDDEDVESTEISFVAWPESDSEFFTRFLTK